jgi:hypothetical protein
MQQLGAETRTTRYEYFALMARRVKVKEPKPNTTTWVGRLKPLMPKGKSLLLPMMQ